MRRIAVLLTLPIAAALTVTGTAHATTHPANHQAAQTRGGDGFKCIDNTSTDVAATHITPNGNVGFTGTVAYRHCINTRRHHPDIEKAMAKTIWSRWFTEDQSQMNCTLFDKAEVNFYLWDDKGHNVNPAKFSVPCRDAKSNTTSKVIPKHQREWLYRSNGHHPRFKANIEVVLDASSNPHLVVSDTLDRLPDIYPFRHRP